MSTQQHEHTGLRPALARGAGDDLELDREEWAAVCPREITPEQWSRFEGYMLEIFTAMGMPAGTVSTADTPRRFLRAVFDAINGLGRIGRAALKILEQADGAEVVAVNDLIPPDNLAYLLRYDTDYGRWHTTVTADGDALVVGGRKIPVLAEQDPASLPWKTLGVDLVLECTGAFRREEDLEKHLAAGARRVILSAPARTETVATVVYGVNQAPAGEQVISCASCTTNCITPVAEVLDRRFGIRQAIMTTVHAYTSSQQLIDGPGKDFRRGRAGAANMLPASTGAALATTKALPALAGKFDGVAIRVPIPAASIADVTAVTARPVTREEVNDAFRDEAAGGRYRGILGVADDSVVSADIIGDPRASVVDAAMTRELVRCLSRS